MNAEIISVGTELLLGQIVNTNAQFLSRELAQIGINVFYHTAVGDNSTRLTQVLANAQKRSNLIIITGGLGPTKDDLTKETVAACFNKNLFRDEKSYEKMSRYFAKISKKMTENNIKQAFVIEGSNVLPNHFGMAPGMAFCYEGCIYMLLPGPPSELMPMFESYGRVFLLDQLENKQYIESRVLRFFGIGESELETKIEDLIDLQTNPTIAPLAVGDGEVTLRLTAKHPSLDQAMEMLDQLEKKIQPRVGEFFFGYNNSSLYEEVFLLLQQKGLTISSAESLTGGAFAKEITNIAGSSAVFNGSIVCYQTEVKRNVLNVPQDVINKHGVVSFECAKYMAENVLEILHTDIGISFTGVAGPSEQEGKRVGTVFVGIAVKDKETKVYPLILSGSRSAIRTRTVKYGYYYLYKYLREK
ncbi:competence/damage-inducible protein A [Calidifontibacillus oryziterrae]|uniref:competence/damage-inducible protein A n=1 Tax=Calidifontibacillus oryziterrae TaxID=1191699 RepID=UPI0002F5A8E6|nr:competence/damage-inducible protein A [Calidifontibacillus oryziterrae]